MDYGYKPLPFFLISLLGTWAFWLPAAFVSSYPSFSSIVHFCVLAGLAMPMTVTLFMLVNSHDKLLIAHFWRRFKPSLIKPQFLGLILLLMPLVLIVATSISLAFGQSASQFLFASEYKVLKGWRILGFLVPVFLAPACEEIGWRGYGVDSIGATYTVFTTTLLFSAIWALWHVPLFFISGSYHQELWHIGLIYVINFFVSVAAASILMNWVYYSTQRSITALIIFHGMINLSAVLLQTTQFTKCIMTLILVMLGAVIVWVYNQLFFNHYHENHNLNKEE